MTSLVWWRLSLLLQHSTISQMLSDSPCLVSTTDPYTGYSALHWAAKVGSRTPALTDLSVSLSTTTTR